MSTAIRKKTSKTTTERQATATALKDRLTQWQADADPGLIAMALATHDGYSDRNACLIAMQCPTATDVSDFRKWLDRGRCVRKGETGIQILAPAGTGIVGKKDDAHGDQGDAPEGGDGEAKVRQFFRVTYVFDIAQTDQLPAKADAKS
jgi:antirestriction protein ArdC